MASKSWNEAAEEAGWRFSVEHNGWINEAFKDKGMWKDPSGYYIASDAEEACWMSGHGVPS